jgi:hypothetical protein
VYIDISTQTSYLKRDLHTLHWCRHCIYRFMRAYNLYGFITLHIAVHERKYSCGMLGHCYWFDVCSIHLFDSFTYNDGAVLTQGHNNRQHTHKHRTVYILSIYIALCIACVYVSRAYMLFMCTYKGLNTRCTAARYC